MIVPVVHAVTNDDILLRADFLAQAEAIMRTLGGRGALHLRARNATARQLHEMASRLSAAGRASGCWLVLNDRVDIACATKSDGVQLTSVSMSPRDAKRVCDIAAGASVHSVTAARAAAAALADWCVLGPVFTTKTHPGAAPCGVACVRETARAVGVPVIAIGGVRVESVAALKAAGARGVAVISGIWDEEDVGSAAGRYLSAYDDYEGSS